MGHQQDNPDPGGMEKDLGFGKLLARTSQLRLLAFSQTHRPGSFSDGIACDLGCWRSCFETSLMRLHPHNLEQCRCSNSSLMMLGLMQTYLNMGVEKTRNQIQDLDTTQVAQNSQPLRGTDANSWQNASPRRRATSGSEVKWRDKSAKLN